MIRPNNLGGFGARMSPAPINSEHRTALSPGVNKIGAQAVYIGKYGSPARPTVMTGTVTATATNVITGTDTLFLTEVSVGDHVALGTLPTTNVHMVKAINSDLELEIYDTVTLGLTDPIARVNVILAGCTDGNKLALNEVVKDTTCSQEGSAASGFVHTGHESSVACGFKRTNAEQAKHFIASFENIYNSLTGAIDRQAYRPKIGLTSDETAVSLYLVELTGPKVETDDPLRIICIPKACPVASAELAWDAETELLIAANFRCFTDDYGDVVYASADTLA